MVLEYDSYNARKLPILLKFPFDRINATAYVLFWNRSIKQSYQKLIHFDPNYDPKMPIYQTLETRDPIWPV